MKREPRTEVMSIRLTRAEREQVDRLGGPTALLRRALVPPQTVLPITTAGIAPGHSITLSGCGIGTSWWIWNDGTVGPNWPALASR